MIKGKREGPKRCGYILPVVVCFTRQNAFLWTAATLLHSPLSLSFSLSLSLSSSLSLSLSLSLTQHSMTMTLRVPSVYRTNEELLLKDWAPPPLSPFYLLLFCKLQTSILSSLCRARLFAGTFPLPHASLGSRRTVAINEYCSDVGISKEEKKISLVFYRGGNIGCQFHQHFIRAFLIRKWLVQLCSNYSLAFVIFVKRISSKIWS